MQTLKTLGIFGGSFNPPHLGHRRLAAAMADKLSLGRLLIIPANTPPHKPAANLATAPDRLAMCRLAFAGDPRFEVSDIELSRPGRSYTYDTLLAVKARHPGAEIHLLVGSDMMACFEKWHRHEDILKLCTPHAFPRDSISSTEIRRRIGAGEDVSGMLDSGVYRYIIDKGIYL